MKIVLQIFVVCCLLVVPAFAAYHHEGEEDANNFLAAYPDKKNTKLDHCALCHSGGSYESKPGKYTTLGSCQWCHYAYGYDGSGNIVDTLNPYGKDYYMNGRNQSAVTGINDMDSDNDGYTNAQEIAAERFPGDASDDPSKTMPPYRIYTRAQIEAMDMHTQFMLMNTSRSGDFYAQYTGVPLKNLLDASGILSSATGITVFAPDGWSQYHPLHYSEDAELYHVYSDFPNQSYQYPPSSYYHTEEAENWCDYSSPYCTGRNNNDPIAVENGMKAILAIKVDGSYLETGVLTDENKLDGDGPFRIVVPQKNPGPPDQSSKSDNQDVIWPYQESWDHNAGACTRSATIIRVEPLPEGTTDLDIYEDGWNYVDAGKIIVYGAINGTDSNGNGILDSEECSDKADDYDKDGIPDYKDTDTARFRPASGRGNMMLYASGGVLSGIRSLKDSDTNVSQENKPDMTFPYGVTVCEIAGLSSGAAITMTLVFPENVKTDATYYKVDKGGWHQATFESNDGDNVITLTLIDGDPSTDADGVADGRILDVGALVVADAGSSGSDDDGLCFVSGLAPCVVPMWAWLIAGFGICGTIFRYFK